MIDKDPLTGRRAPGDPEVASARCASVGADHLPVGHSERPRWYAAAAGMADRLHDEGHLRDPRWHRAFAEVPRHLLLPDGPYDGRRRESLGPSGAGGDEITACYGVVIPEARSAGRLLGFGLDPDPGALAWMLGMLGRRDRPMRILQIGIGHGYLTALLCADLGDGQVVVVEADPGLARSTGAVLGELGWFPQIVGPDDLEPPGRTGVFDGVLVVGEVPRSALPLWKDQGAPWDRYVGRGGRLILGPLWFPDIGRGFYVAERAADGQMGRLGGVFDIYPLTESDLLALAHLRQNRKLTERLRAAHIAGGKYGECQGCMTERGARATPPCATRRLVDTALAAAAVMPPGSDPAIGPDPATDTAIVDYLAAYPRALDNALAAHAADNADADGICAGCRTMGIVTTAPCHRLALAEMAADHNRSVRPAVRNTDSDSDSDWEPDSD